LWKSPVKKVLILHWVNEQVRLIYKQLIHKDMQFEMLKDKSSIIKVIGVGGGGGNAVNHM
jgi:cell division protein FtsZ